MPETVAWVLSPTDPAKMSPHGAFAIEAWLVPTPSQYSSTPLPALHSKVTVGVVNVEPWGGVVRAGIEEGGGGGEEGDINPLSPHK